MENTARVITESELQKIVGALEPHELQGAVALMGMAFHQLLLKKAMSDEEKLFTSVLFFNLAKAFAEQHGVPHEVLEKVLQGEINLVSFEVVPAEKIEEVLKETETPPIITPSTGRHVH